MFDDVSPILARALANKQQEKTIFNRPDAQPMINEKQSSGPSPSQSRP